jgi:DNA-binding NarL/FixJ family response regulator
MIKVALVDDHSLFRRGMKMLLSAHPEIEVVVDAASGEEFLAAISQVEVDVVFMDYDMPGLNGAQTTERALTMRSDMKVVALSMFGDNAYYTHMMECGAKGFMLKDSEFDQVIEAVKTVYAGGTYFSESLLESLAQSLRVTPSLAMEQPDEDRLSEREVEILVAICRGLSTQEIADELYISKRTVDKHRANILEKSGCKNTASLVVYAIKNGIVEL